MKHSRWPTLGDYLDWAKSQDFKVELAQVACGEQRLIMIAIIAPSGAHVVELADDLTDPLMSSSIAKLDRRLGTKSWLFD